MRRSLGAAAELLSQLCFDLVLWAEKHEREAELILTAYEQNPGNVLLRRFAAEAGIAVRATEPIPDPLLNAHQRERLHEALLST